MTARGDGPLILKANQDFGVFFSERRIKYLPKALNVAITRSFIIQYGVNTIANHIRSLTSNRYRFVFFCTGQYILSYLF